MSELYWDSTYAIAVALMERYPHIQPEMVGLDELTVMIENLPGFVDDPALATERMLLDIQITWYEEIT
ncbi:MAG: Fe-S cluster assembly protein IscX [Anaerolineae bacterium]|nr:Fe-S cluster assembly protein IscX [Anaerolineae bacterium]